MFQIVYGNFYLVDFGDENHRWVRANPTVWCSSYDVLDGRRAWFGTHTDSSTWHGPFVTDEDAQKAMRELYVS